MEEILLVEDDEDLRTDLAAILRDEGHAVSTAVNGADALSWLAAGHKVSLILLDLMMPVLDGWEFRAQQLSDPDLAPIPVIVMSGAGDVRGHASSLQAAAYLTKPFTISQIVATLRRVRANGGPAGANGDGGRRSVH